MDEQKQKLIERIRQAQNILVTVSANPSVDQLAACIALTIALNKLEKHGTAVFSGAVPSTIEFLKPEATLEKDTNSLRDFIIALDKSKADKLRYKVEDQVVRIFITPYKTSLSEADLNFSQGDFNVDVVIALGVTEQQDLDAAITAHGRILHDATVASVTTTGQGSLGTINWVDPTSSSLSEMIVSLIDGLDKKALDNQIATALLTGIVASTERFSNERTTPKTMSASAALMAAGANQQLIATELAAPEQPAPIPVVIADITPPSGADASGGGAKREPGTLEIDHESFAAAVPEPGLDSIPVSDQPQIQVDADGQLHLEGQPAPAPVPQISQVRGVASDGDPATADGQEVTRELITAPPQLGTNEITANARPEDLEPSAEELTLPAVQGPLLSHKESVLAPLPAPDAAAPATPLSPPPFEPPTYQPAPPSWMPPASPAPATPPALDTAAPPPFEPPVSVPPAAPAPAGPSLSPIAPVPTLTDLEKSVASPHVQITEEGVFSSVPDPASIPAANPTVVPATAPAPAPVTTPADPLATAMPAPPAEPAATAPAEPVAPAAPPASLDNARDAVAAAFNSPAAPATPAAPLAALNAQPLGPDLRPLDSAPAVQSPALQPTFTPQTPDLASAPSVPDPLAATPLPVLNTGFNEPTPGSTPADSTLDMPMPSNPFGPGQSLPAPAPLPAPPSSFPGSPAPAPAGPPPPPVPPPMVPPIQ